MKLSINNVRSRLGDLVMPIFFSKTFHEKYMRLSSLPQEEAMATVEKNHMLLKAFVNSIASKLTDAEFCEQAVSAVPDEIILSMYIVYSLITQSLVGADQSQVITVPESNAEFFQYMFNDFLFDNNQL